MKLFASLAVAALAILPGQQSPLDQPQPLQMSALVPLQRVETFLLASKIASAVQMPLGFEEAGVLPPGNSQQRLQHSLAGMSVREAFNQIVTLDPRYDWHEINGIAVFRPTTAWTDTANILNRHVDNVALDNVTQTQAADRLLKLLFNQPSPVPNPHYTGPTFSAHVASGTVLDVLDTTVKAGGLIWNVDPAQAGHRQVTLRTFEGGGTVRSWPAE